MPSTLCWVSSVPSRPALNKYFASSLLRLTASFIASASSLVCLRRVSSSSRSTSIGASACGVCWAAICSFVWTGDTLPAYCWLYSALALIVGMSAVCCSAFGTTFCACATSFGSCCNCFSQASSRILFCSLIPASSCFACALSDGYWRITFEPPMTPPRINPYIVDFPPRSHHSWKPGLS